MKKWEKFLTDVFAPRKRPAKYIIISGVLHERKGKKWIPPLPKRFINKMRKILNG